MISMIAQQVVMLRWLLEDDWAAPMPTNEDSQYDYLSNLKQALDFEWCLAALDEYERCINPDERFSDRDKFMAYVENVKDERRKWVQVTAHDMGFVI